MSHDAEDIVLPSKTRRAKSRGGRNPEIDLHDEIC
jgi:hypothetical protein